MKTKTWMMGLVIAIAWVVILPPDAPAAARTGRSSGSKPAVAARDAGTNLAARVVALEKDNQSLQQIVADAEVRLNAIEKEKTSASARLESEKKEHYAEQLKREAAGKEVSRLKEEVAGLRASLEKNGTELEVIKKRAADAEAARKNGEREKASASARINELEEQVSAARQASVAEARKQEKEKLALEASLAAESTRAREKARLVTTLERKQAEAEARLKAIEKEKASASAQCEEFRAAAEKQRRDSEVVEANLRKSVAAAVEQQTRTMKTLEALRGQKDECNRVLSEVTEQRDVLAQKERKLSEQLSETVRQWRDEERVRNGRALREQIDDPANPALVWSLNDAGLLMLGDGRIDEAEMLFRRALALLDQRGSRNGPVAASLIQHLADTCWRKGNLESAESLYRESAALMKASVGEAHPRYASVLNGLAGVLHARKQDRESEAFYRKAVTIYESADDAPATDLAVSSHNLGMLVLEQGRLDEAGPLLQKAATLVDGREDVRALIIMRSLARFYQSTGNVEQAAIYEARANDLAVNVMTP